MVEVYGMDVVAVLVASVAYFALGGAWYAAFSKPWTRAMGLTPETMPKGAAVGYVLAFVGGVFSVGVLAWLFGALGYATALEGAFLGAVVWIPLGAGGFVHAVFESRNMTLWTLNAGYNLVGLVASGLVIALWP